MIAVATNAHALPVKSHLDLKPGAVFFVKGYSQAREARSADPSVATAELLPAGELLLTAVKPGWTIATVVTKVTVDTVLVRVCPAEGCGPRPSLDLSPISPACGLFTEVKSDVPGLTPAFHVEVKSAACWRALQRALLAEDGDHEAPRLTYTFTPEALQAQAAALAEAVRPLAPGLSLKMSGAEVVVEGKASPAERSDALVAIARVALGNVYVDDRSEAK